MAAGFPVKADYATGDVLSAANMNDLAGTLNYLDPTAKGDLFPASSGTALTRLAVGANDTVLTADSTTATGLKWAAPAGGNKVLQVVNASTGTSTTITSTTYTDTTLTATITPSSASSKVLVFYTQNLLVQRNTADINALIQLVRGATSVQDLKDVVTMNFGTASTYLGSIYAASYLDSPATTSATTYKTQVKLNTIANSGTSTAQFNNGLSTITLMEIGA